jgi:hypothetical protein
MKNLVWLCCLLLAGCAAPKAQLNETSALHGHPQPFTIFGIGYLNKSYMVLTLTDAAHQYVTIIIPKDESLKVGQEYAVSH